MSDCHRQAVTTAVNSDGERWRLLGFLSFSFIGRIIVRDLYLPLNMFISSNCNDTLDWRLSYIFKLNDSRYWNDSMSIVLFISPKLCDWNSFNVQYSYFKVYLLQHHRQPMWRSTFNSVHVHSLFNAALGKLCKSLGACRNTVRKHFSLLHWALVWLTTAARLVLTR